MTSQSPPKPPLLNRWHLASLGVALIPAVFVIAMFSASALAPPGADPAHHATFARDILDSQRAYVRYSQFPSGGLAYEYPSLFDLSVALLVAGTGADLLATMEALVVGLTIVSPLVMWRFVQRFFGGGPRDAFIAVAFVSLNWFLMLKTIRDGSYGELLAAGVLLPLWLSFLWDRRDILAAGTLFAIVLTHNLTALLALGCFSALLIHFALNRQWTRIRRTVLAHAGVLGLTAVLVWSVYASYLFPVSTGVAGAFPVIDLPTYILLLTPALFLLGVLGAALLARSPRLRFVTLWIVAYAILSRTSFASERITREMSFPLAIGAAGLALHIVHRVEDRHLGDIPVWAPVALTAVVYLSALNGIIWTVANSDPTTLEYMEPYQLAAYHWLADHSNESESVLALAAADPYLPVFVPNDVFPVVNLIQGDFLSVPDRALNVELVNALANYTNATSRAVFSAHGIQWIVLSSPFPPPRWIAPQDLPFINQTWSLNLDSDPHYALRHLEGTISVGTRVYQVIGS